MNLPKIPPHPRWDWRPDEAQVLREYGQACAAKAVLEEREACAQLAERTHPDDWKFLPAYIRSRMPK